MLAVFGCVRPLRSLSLRLPRGFFGPFKQKPVEVEEREAPSTAMALRGQTFNQNRPRELSKKEAYFEELRVQREKEDKEARLRKSETEFLEGAARKEADVTLRTLDFRTIILVNQRWVPSGEFASLQAFKDFLHQLERRRFTLTEETAEKMLKGFLDFADQGAAELSASLFFQHFLGLLETTFSYFSRTDQFRLAAAFMDVYCISNPPLWHALETQVLARKDQFGIEELVETLTRFANQGEGTDMFFDALEARLMREMGSLSLARLVDVLTSYFNRKMGRKEFLLDLIGEIIRRLEGDLFLVDVGVVRRLALAVSDLGELFDPLKKRLFKAIEEQVLEKKMDLTFTDCCLFAKAFGFDNGSPRLMVALDALTEEELPQADLELTRLYVDGFLLSYKVSKNAFEVLDAKLIGFLSSLSLFESVRIAKAYFMLGHEGRPLVRLIEQKVLVALYNDWESLDPHSLYETVHSYCLTRLGSRELYRVLEMVLSRRLDTLAKDRVLIQRLVAIYRESGMCSHQFLTRMQRFE